MAACEVILREASAGVEMAKQQDFGRGFEILDGAAKRLDDLAKGTDPADQDTVKSARTRLEAMQDQARQALADWAKPYCDRAQETFRVATDRVNDDEDGIEMAYAQVYPVLRWKERLPIPMKAQVEMLVVECRENLNDKEWAKAEALARGQK